MIFLYRFELVDNGINFVLNEKIIEDLKNYGYMWEEDLNSLVFSLSNTLSRYQRFSKSNIIFYCNLFDNNELEVSLSEGLGKFVDEYTKHQIIFEHGKLIAEVLTKVMNLGVTNRK